MLDDLVRTIEKLQSRIREHSAFIGTYESRTRISLIDPMLCVLGWEVGDPTTVHVEVPVTSGRPDYALLGINGHPVTFIEAKKLSTSISDETIAQVAQYVMTENVRNSHKVPYCTCTNGDYWVVYDCFAHKRILETRISEDTPMDCAFKLLGLWQHSLADGSLRSPMQPKHSAPLTLSEPAIEDKPRANQGIVGPPSDWTSLTDDFNPKGTKPEYLRLPDGKQVPANSWGDVILQVANWLLVADVGLRDKLPIRMGKGRNSRRYLMHSHPVHLSGKPFTVPRKLAGGQLHLETKMSATEIVNHIQKLLKLCGKTPDSIGLKCSS